MLVNNKERVRKSTMLLLLNKNMVSFKIIICYILSYTFMDVLNTIRNWNKILAFYGY